MPSILENLILGDAAYSLHCAHFIPNCLQDELEDIAAAHEAGLVEVEEDDEEISDEARKIREDARVREDMADMGFG
jgi:hypothetical protein